MSDRYDARWRLTTAAAGIGALLVAGLGLRYVNLPALVMLPFVLPGVLLLGAAVAPRATLPTLRSPSGQRVGAWSVFSGAVNVIIFGTFFLFAAWLAWDSSGWWRLPGIALAVLALSQLVPSMRALARDLRDSDADDEPDET